ncbi:hypothetical protein ACSE35_08615, partial [Staphylococcus aureus]
MALSKKQTGNKVGFHESIANDTLSAWLLIESLSPGEVNFTAEDILSAEHFKNGAKQAQLQSFDEYFEIWNAERFI